jgi:uncharacterized DUF497 family protein
MRHSSVVLRGASLKLVGADVRVEHPQIKQIAQIKICYLMIGMTSAGLLLVSFTYRDETVRLISARVAEKRFVKVYEDEN